MSTKTERRCARRRERRKFSPVIPSRPSTVLSPLFLALHARRRCRRRCRTARRCNVHFYGRSNQAAAPVTRCWFIASQETVLCYSVSFRFLPSLLLSFQHFNCIKIFTDAPTALFPCFPYLISNANDDSRPCSSEFH